LLARPVLAQKTIRNYCWIAAQPVPDRERHQLMNANQHIATILK